MERHIPKPGERYRHYKGTVCQILCVAAHAGTKEKLVVYQALYGEFEIFARPLDLFLGEVGQRADLNAPTKYRFERIETEKACMEESAIQKGSRDAPSQRREPESGVSAAGAEAAFNEDGQVDVTQEQAKDAGEQANPALLAFLDADTMEEKYQILKTMGNTITDRLIDDFAVVLDLVIPEGGIETRYQQLLSSLRTMQRYENTRLRRW